MPQSNANDVSAERGWDLFLVVNDWIRHADAKAAVALTFVAALAAATVVVIPPMSEMTLASAFFSIGSLVALAFGGCFALAAVWPRLHIRGQAAANPLYFRHAAGFSDASTYSDKLRPALSDDAEFVRYLIDQVYANSKVADRKFARVDVAVWLIGLAVLLLTTLVVVEWLNV